MFAISDMAEVATVLDWRGVLELGRPELDTRWAPPGNVEALQRGAKELVAMQPDLILSHTTPTTATLLQQTRSIPIIFAFVSDPLGSGFVASFSRPGGNVTGFIVMEPGMAGKWLELLKEIAPKAVPAQAGNGWRVFIPWASGRIQYISGFESLQDAEHWIATEAQNWLNALNTQL